MMTKKENYLAAMRHEPHDFIPCFTDAAMAGNNLETFENGPIGGGFDGFGCKWYATESAGGQGVPAAGHIVLDDVTKWRDVVKFPNLDDYDWEGQSKLQLANYNRDEQALVYGMWNAQFLRFTHLLGFENGLCSLYEEPEASFELLSAITDYKIRLAEYAVKYFHPDVINTYDDVATGRSLFMSPQVYRELIKPQHKRFNDAVRRMGVLVTQHCCGKCEEIIPDFIEEGASCWSAAQPMNDIAGIIKKYGDRITVEGGYNTNGSAGRSDVTEDEIRAEVRRVINEYAQGGRFIFMGFFLSYTKDAQGGLDKMMIMLDEFNKFSANYYIK